MKNKWFCGLCLLCGLTHAGTVSAQSEMTRFVDELMSRMTLEEKLGQLNQLPGDDINTGTPSATRIGKDSGKSTSSRSSNHTTFQIYLQGRYIQAIWIKSRMILIVRIAKAKPIK